ncbi:MAG: LuxR C-terminal-related transcriptional regulator [Asticcacaulis sp.]
MKRGRPPYNDSLTPAEWRVVEAVRHGISNLNIAALRKISLDAVKYHVRNACQKLELPNRQALRHWDGVARGTALYAREKQMNETLKLGEIGQIARTVKDRPNMVR